MTSPCRALCAELVDALENARRIIEGADGTLHINTAEFVLRRARALLDRQEPEDGDIHYAWELHDDEGDWQAGGSAITLESVRREGGHYLQIYSQEGPHTLIIQRVSTIEEITND